MSWEDHFKILKRWYYRCRGLNVGLTDGSGDVFSSPQSYPDDFFRAFFLTCHHFKDWLASGSVASKQELDAYINKNLALQLCADVANFSKHANLTTTRTGDLNTKGVGRMYMVMLPGGSSYVASLLTIESGGKQYDPLEIVHECMNAWGAFLISKSMAIPELVEERIFKNFVKWEPPKGSGL